MHVCCCWLHKGRVAKDEQRLQHHRANNALFLEEIQKCLQHFGTLSTARWLFFFGLSILGPTRLWLPSLLLITQTAASVTQSQSGDSAETSGGLREIIQTLSAICRCCQVSQFRQGFLPPTPSPSLPCDVLIWPSSLTTIPGVTDSFCCVTVFLYFAFSFYWCDNCVTVHGTRPQFW